MARSATAWRSMSRAASPPRASVEWAYFFDIDGTLVDIASQPDRIHVDASILTLLRTLYERTGGAVALITGRSIADVQTFFPIAQLPVAGQHGLEWRDMHETHHTSTIPIAELDALRQELATIVTRHPGLLVEFKGLSIALHYRLNPRLGGYAARVMQSLRSRFVPDFVLLRGKRVIELKPAGRDKGMAIHEFMQMAPFVNRVPVFVGDDTTDEAGFAVVNAMGGHSVRIGPGHTCAQWCLSNVSAVRGWLTDGLQAN